MGLKTKLKATVTGLTSTQQVILVFAASILPTMIFWLQQIGAGAEINTQSLALFGSAVLGAVLAAIVKMLAPTSEPAIEPTSLPPPPTPSPPPLQPPIQPLPQEEEPI